jgi:ubiquinone/menaquinone biosynthesis C-methylase UbiE
MGRLRRLPFDRNFRGSRIKIRPIERSFPFNSNQVFNGIAYVPERVQRRRRKAMAEIFDPWSEKYDQWFETPMGQLIKGYEGELILNLLMPGPGDFILDAGCGTGVFTAEILETGAGVVGLERSHPMLVCTVGKCVGRPFLSVLGDMRRLPFADDAFHKAVSITAIEFIKEAKSAVEEMFRVTRPGGIVVVATLNSLSPWARQRKEAAKKGHPLFKHAVFRSPEEIARLSPVGGIVQTAIHFNRNDPLDLVPEIEREGREKGLDTGAFLAACWINPG